MTSGPRRIYLAGHRGLAGSAILLELQSRIAKGEPWEVLIRTRAELDLLDEDAVRTFFASERPSHVILAAARVGGIKANRDFPVEFLLDNIKIQNHVIEHAWHSGAQKLLFLGSSCIYPKLAPQPIPETALLTGPLEPTNDAYAIAKIAGIKLCQALRSEYGVDFISAMPTNLYGPNDNFDPESSHVLPGLLHRFHRAKVERLPAVTLWGSGTPRREFMHADDLASACLMLLEQYSSPDPINIGTGTDVTIRELGELIRATVGYEGKLEWDASQPDGTPRKLLDVSRINALGWSPRIALAEGLASTYQWFVEHRAEART